MGCPMCGGVTSPQTINYEERREGKLYSFVDVPALVCDCCGDITFSAEVMRKMDEAVDKHKQPDKYEQVPVFSLAA